MNLRFIPLFALVTLVLSSCNLLNVVPTADLVIDVDTAGTVSQIEIRVSQDDETGAVGFVIPGIRLKAFARAGSIGATVENYSIDYFYANATKAPTALGESFRSQLSLNVPAGIRCQTSTTECTLNTKNVGGQPDYVFEAGQAVFSSVFLPIDIDIIGRLFPDTTRPGAYASIALEGRDTNGNSFTYLIPKVNIIFVAGD